MQKIKKNLVILATTVLLCTSNVFANRNIKITLDGNEIKTDVAPFIKEDRTLVPIKFISEALNYDVKWNEAKRTVAIKSSDKNMLLTIDNKNINVNGQNKVIDVAPTIYNDRTYVPVRFISENFGIDVDWNDKTSTVILKNNTSPLSSLSLSEKEYVNAIENYKKINNDKINELKSYFFENADKFSVTEKEQKYDEISKVIDENIRNIANMEAPAKFKNSHKFLIEAVSNGKLMIQDFKTALIDGNSTDATKVIDLFTRYSIKMNETEKALQSEIQGVQYTPDKDIEIYNEKSKETGNAKNLLEDETIKNLLNRV